MGEVVQYQPQQVVHHVPNYTMQDMWQISQAIAKGGLFGSNDPNAVLTLCMVAQAEGKHPGLVLQQYHIIKGKPAKKAEAMLVDFLAAGGRVEWHTLTDECADATFSHSQGGSVRIQWDMARAAKAGLGTATWKAYPRQMLRSRVVSEGVRTVFPGATSGMYVPEEVQEFDTPVPRDAMRQQAHEETVAALAAPEPDPRTVKWVDGYIAKLDAAETRSELLEVVEANVPHMDRLRAKWPALFERATQAEQTRGYAFTTEGRDDDAFGDQHTDDGE